MRHILIVVAAILLAMPDALPAELGAYELKLKAGAEIEHFTYDEPGIMEESGFLYGYSGGLMLEKPGELFLDLTASLVIGDLDYDGSIQTDSGLSIPFETTTPNVVFNVRGLGGPIIDHGPVVFRPYSGLGYRLLIDDLADPAPDLGYRRDQTYIYLPLGLNVQLPSRSKDAWSFSFTAEYDFFLYAQNKSHKGVLGSGFTFEQDSGYGFRASCSLASPERNGVSISVGPFYEYWDVDDSEVKAGFLEPANSSELFGLRASVNF